MSQRFLLSAKARTLSLSQIARLSDDEAYQAFRAVRFAESEGEPVCPDCDCEACYEFKSRSIFKCKRCDWQFSVTSGTIFASRKMSLRDLLLAIAIFMNGANGVSALRLSRELRCDYKTAFVLLHKLREMLASMRADRKLNGEVEIDGVWVGGHRKKANRAEDRIDLRKSSPKRRSVVGIRERSPGGRTLTFNFKHEADAVAIIAAHVDLSATVFVDSASHWNSLELIFPNLKRINHSVAYSLLNGIHTNWIESFNSRLRRGERGVYHHISGNYLSRYADEFAWREDYRRVSNGGQFSLVVRQAAKHPVSARMRGYWQRERALPNPRAPAGSTSG